METRTLKLIVCPKNEPIFHERATSVEIMDEAGGEFVRVTQVSNHPEEGSITIDADEWPYIKAAIDQLIGQCRGINQ